MFLTTSRTQRLGNCGEDEIRYKQMFDHFERLGGLVVVVEQGLSLRSILEGTSGAPIEPARSCLIGRLNGRGGDHGHRGAYKILDMIPISLIKCRLWMDQQQRGVEEATLAHQREAIFRGEGL